MLRQILFTGINLVMASKTRRDISFSPEKTLFMKSRPIYDWSCTCRMNPNMYPFSKHKGVQWNIFYIYCLGSHPRILISKFEVQHCLFAIITTAWKLLFIIPRKTFDVFPWTDFGKHHSRLTNGKKREESRRLTDKKTSSGTKREVRCVYERSGVR